MNSRRLLLMLAALLLVFIILATGAVGALLWLSARSQVGQGQLLVFGDAQLELINRGSEPSVLSKETTSEGFLYPAPSPDGTQVAYITSGAGGTHLFVQSIQSGERKTLFSVPQPLQLLYMNWSPDGRYLAFMTPSGISGLGVFVVPADGSSQPQLVSGAQSAAYFTWTPDSRSLLLHLDGSRFENGRIATFTLGQEKPTIISQEPGFFQSPAWSADGTQLFYVTQPEVTSAQPSFDDIESILTRSTPDGSGSTELVREKGAVIFFARAPRSDEIAYTSLNFQEKRFGPLTLVNGQTGEHRIVSRENDHVVAFFWSPDGEQLAYLTRKDDGNPGSDHTWYLTNSSGNARELVSFSPSRSFVGLVSFFDAYAHTFTIWSADSRMLTYASDDGVYTLDATSGATTRISDGELGMWVRPARR